MFFGFFCFLAIANLQILTPGLVQIADRYLGESLDVEQVEIDWVNSLPTLRIHGLKLKRTFDTAITEFYAESLEIRLAQTVWEATGMQFDYIGLKSPVLEGQAILHSRAQSEESTLGISGWYWWVGVAMSRLRNIQNLEIDDGSYDMLLISDENYHVAKGDYALTIIQDGASHILNSTVTASWRNPTNMNIHIHADSKENNEFTARVLVDIDSVDLAWLSILLPPSIVERAPNFEEMDAVVNANIRADWKNNQFESAQWSISVSDTIWGTENRPSRTNSIGLVGSWDPNVQAGESQVQTYFSVSTIEVAELLERYGGLFPPKFQNYMSSHLISLELADIQGGFSFDPISLLESQEYAEASVQGSYFNFTFDVKENWPKLENGNGTFAVNGKRLDAVSEKIYFHGILVEDSSAYIEDIFDPDPIFNIQAAADAPASVVIDFYGPNGVMLPGRIEAITGFDGLGNLELGIQIPFKRGKEFVLNGKLTTSGVAAETSFQIDAHNVESTIFFDRYGITQGDVQATVLGGQMTTSFAKETVGDQLIVKGEATGTGDASELAVFFGDNIVSQLSGDFKWQADYAWSSEGSTINVSTSLDQLESSLPVPLKKPAGFSWPLKATIQNQGKENRSVTFDIDPVVKGSINTLKKGQNWSIQSGAIAVGGAEVPAMLETGVNINLYSPWLDVDEWLPFLSRDAVNVELNFRESFKRAAVNVDKLILSRKRELHDVSLGLDKLGEYWNVSIQSPQFVGVAKYREAAPLGEGKPASIEAELVRCHMPEANAPMSGKAIDPSSLPKLDFRCMDTKYGKYSVGQVEIIAEPADAYWDIRSVTFNSPALEAKAAGKWHHSQNSELQFDTNSKDFGEMMSDFGYGGTFYGGEMNISGNLHWDDAMTNWSAAKTSGNVRLAGVNVNLQTDVNTTALDLINIFNYEIILNTLTRDITNLSNKGIQFDNLTGEANLENGVIHIPAVYFSGPSVEILANGSTNWATKEFDLTAGVTPKLSKSITLIATLINPVTGLYTYLSSEILEKLDIDLFQFKYHVGGTWKQPEMDVISAAKVSNRDAEVHIK